MPSRVVPGCVSVGMRMETAHHCPVSRGRRGLRNMAPDHTLWEVGVRGYLPHALGILFPFVSTQLVDRQLIQRTPHEILGLKGAH